MALEIIVDECLNLFLRIFLTYLECFREANNSFLRFHHNAHLYFWCPMLRRNADQCAKALPVAATQSARRMTTRPSAPVSQVIMATRNSAANVSSVAPTPSARATSSVRTSCARSPVSLTTLAASSLSALLRIINRSGVVSSKSA